MDWVGHFDRLATLPGTSDNTYKVNGFIYPHIVDCIRSCVRHILTAEKPSCIIDIGCGDGSVTGSFSEIIPVYGIDGSKNMLKLANAHGLKTVHCNFEDILNLDLRPRGPTCIVLCECLVCVRDTNKFLTDIITFASQLESKIIISIPYQYSIARRLFQLFSTSKTRLLCETEILSPFLDNGFTAIVYNVFPILGHKRQKSYSKHGFFDLLALNRVYLIQAMN